jgi:hypothetical protein
MPKLIYSKVQEVLDYFKGTVLNNNQIKSEYTVNAGFADYLFEFNKVVFLIYAKWDRGSMSENNINLFLKACSFITSHSNMIGKQFYGIIISKKPTHPFKIDRLVNIHLDHSAEVNILEDGLGSMNIKDIYINSMDVVESKSKLDESNNKLEEKEINEIQMKLYSYITNTLTPLVSNEYQLDFNQSIDTDSDMC